MPSLHSELRRHLDGWEHRLPRAWRETLDGVAPNFCAVPRHAALDQGQRIVPARRVRRGVFYALEGLDPCDVNVVVIGSDPYPDPCRATGRSFEQGDLTEWIDDLAVPGKVASSLLGLACAAAALHPGVEAPPLDSARLCDRRMKLRRALKDGSISLESPRSSFENLTGQGVFWINRTLTTSVRHSRTHRGKRSWRVVEGQRRWHRALWRPVMRRIVRALIEEACERTVVFALFGDEARKLRPQMEAQGRCLDVPSVNLCFVESGHPSTPRCFFRCGNPLGRINDELTARRCDPIDWCGPPKGRPVANNPDRISAAIMDRTVGKYRATLKRLAER